MPFVAINFKTSPQAPIGQWVCTRTSNSGPHKTVPPASSWHAPGFCGQCVSYVTTVCPTIPVNTGLWVKGAPVKGGTGIVPGTAIATFNAREKYEGHAAIYVSQDPLGIHVYDQWVSGTHPKAIGPRLIRWNGQGVSNNGDGFFVVEF